MKIMKTNARGNVLQIAATAAFAPNTYQYQPGAIAALAGLNRAPVVAQVKGQQELVLFFRGGRLSFGLFYISPRGFDCFTLGTELQRSQAQAE